MVSLPSLGLGKCQFEPGLPDKVTKERGEESKMKKNKKSKDIDSIKRLIAHMKFATQLKIAQEKNKKNINK